MCPQQFSARQKVCALIGTGPYDPAIDPANFTNSTNINNTYFPLVPGTTFHYRTINPSNLSAVLETDKFTVTRTSKTILRMTYVLVQARAFSDGG